MGPEDIASWITLITGGSAVLITIITICCTVVPIVAIFGGIFWYIGKRSKQAGAVRQAAQAWVQTNGTVIRSRVEVSGGETTSVSPRVIYQYEVRGRVYQNDQIRAGDKFIRISTSADAYATIDRYPEGLSVTVFYNPANPQESALER
jgi:hypothetical protein